MTQFILCHFRILFHGTVFIKKGSNVGGYIETGARHGHIIGHQHIQIFPFQLFFTVLYDIIRFCSKAYKELAFLFLPQTIKNIRVLGQLNVQNIMGLFFDFLGGLHFGAIIGHSCCHDGGIAVIKMGIHGTAEFPGITDVFYLNT